MSQSDFAAVVEAGYSFKGKCITLGTAVYQGQTQVHLPIRLPLRTLNRHGLIAGATGTGKTKTLQALVEQLSLAGVPSLVMDIKGDLSGIAVAGVANERVVERAEKTGIAYVGHACPVEFLTLSGEMGVRLRATVTEFGPVLFSRILGLNDNQAGAVAVVFKYCDDEQLPLIDLKDFKKTLQYLTNEGKEAIQEEYGRIATASAGTILRKVLELEQQGADVFFGEPSFEVADLCRTNAQGHGVVSVLRVTDMQDRPKLFSTFMLSLLAEVYNTLPEVGDPEAPKLCLFIDEAHLVFQEASRTLLDQLEAVIKLIRSKGVGIFFITQSPADIPAAVLGQLGLKVQHALRAFTAKDRQAIKLAAQNYPESSFYKTDELLTQLGIGEALITGLNEKGVPTPLVHAMLRTPGGRMDVLTDSEQRQLVGGSALVAKYNRAVDRNSAYELLTQKIREAQSKERQTEIKRDRERATSTTGRREKSVMEEVMNHTVTKQVLRTVAREAVRGLMGVLGFNNSKRR